MTYGEWYALYVDLYKRKLKPKSRESHARLHALLMPTIGGLLLEQISPDDIQRALLDVETRAGSRQAQLAYALMHAVLRRACRSRRLTFNPVEAVDKPEHEARKGRAVSGEDWLRLRPIIDEDVCFALMAYAGLRRGEVLGLQRGDVDLQEGMIHVRRQRLRVDGALVTSAPKSEAGVRDVPISAELLPILSAACRLQHPSARLCACAPETLAHRWRRAQLQEGIMQPDKVQ